MSLLLPDYSSSSDDEDAPRAPQSTHVLPPVTAPVVKVQEATIDSNNIPKPTVKKTATKKKKKTVKTTLHLPPEIQRLLESGTLGDSDDDDADDSLLAKHKRAVAKRPRTDAATTPQPSTSLSFLPAPKHQLPEPKPAPVPANVQEETVEATASEVAEPLDSQAMATDTVGYTQYYQQQYDAQQYAQYYQHQQQQAEYYAQPAEGELPSAGKRARHRDRELERLLQTGQFGAIADKIVEVQAPAPDAWQAPPVEELRKTNASDVKVKASFWNSSAGTTVSSMKPSRLQRQKHQLNQLAFDAKAREAELLDRKGAGIKTKRETHAKYGW